MFTLSNYDSDSLQFYLFRNILGSTIFFCSFKISFTYQKKKKKKKIRNTLAKLGPKYIFILREREREGEKGGGGGAWIRLKKKLGC